MLPQSSTRQKNVRKEGEAKVSRYGRVNAALKEIQVQEPLFRKMHAFKQGLPLDFYEQDGIAFEYECQAWPNDYTFIRQIQYMYD